MYAINRAGRLTKPSLIALCSTTLFFQFYFSMNCCGVVAGRRCRALTVSVHTGKFNTAPSKQRLCLVPSPLPLSRKGYPSNLQSKSLLFSTSTTGSTMSTFQPPEPPGTKGTPIFPDIKILKPEELHQNENAIRRNTDSNAVMVVTGANRGIGLQFVKSLLFHSKVRKPCDHASPLQKWFNQVLQLILFFSM